MDYFVYGQFLRRFGFFVGFIVRPDQIYHEYAVNLDESLHSQEELSEFDRNMCEKWIPKSSESSWQDGSYLLAPSDTRQTLAITVACVRELKSRDAATKGLTAMLANMGWSRSDFFANLRKTVDQRDQVWNDLFVSLLILILPPIIAFVFGIAALWAIAGFRVNR